MAQLIKNLPAMWEIWVQSLGWEDPLEKEKATYCSILAWRIPWIVHSMGLQRVGHDWVPFTSFHIRSSQSTEWGSLSCTVCSHYLPFLHMVLIVYICQSLSSNPSYFFPSLSLLVSIHLFSTAVPLFLPCKSDHLTIFLEAFILLSERQVDNPPHLLSETVKTKFSEVHNTTTETSML